MVINDIRYDQEVVEYENLTQKSIGDNPEKVDNLDDNLESILKK